MALSMTAIPVLGMLMLPFPMFEVSSWVAWDVSFGGYEKSKQCRNYLDDVGISQEVGIAPSKNHEDGEHECRRRDQDGDDGRKTHVCSWRDRAYGNDDIADGVFSRESREGHTRLTKYYHDSAAPPPWTNLRIRLRQEWGSRSCPVAAIERVMEADDVRRLPRQPLRMPPNT